MRSRKTVSLIMLSGASLIWGTSFIAQILGMEYIGPFTFNAMRYLAAVAFMVPFTFALDGYWARRTRSTIRDSFHEWKEASLPGVICGTLLFTAATLQQYGLLFTTASKAAFITATYIVIVPVYGLFFKKIPSKVTTASVIMSIIGLYLLTVPDVGEINAGDALIFTGAFFWAAHIMACGHFAGRGDPVKISTIQFAAVAVLAGAAMLIAESPDIHTIITSWKPILYAGLLCTGVAYSMQMAAQRDVSPVATCVILTGETLFGAIFGWLLLGDNLSGREIAGCTILIAASLATQLYEILSNQHQS